MDSQVEQTPKCTPETLADACGWLSIMPVRDLAVGKVPYVRLPAVARDQLVDLLAGASSALSASLALPKVESETWQPIETAPKDGACILVWADGFEWPEIIRWYFYDPDIAEEEGVDGYWHYAEESMHDHFDWEHEVTHWRPRPAPPSTLNTGGTHG